MVAGESMPVATEFSSDFSSVLFIRRAPFIWRCSNTSAKSDIPQRKTATPPKLPVGMSVFFVTKWNLVRHMVRSQEKAHIVGEMKFHVC
jgi:hypothetical protein